MSAKKSTNGRTINQRLIFQVLERAWPAGGARLVHRIWFRVPPVSEKAKRLRVELPESVSFELPFENGTVRGRIWGEGPAVCLLHGWGGWGLQLAAFIPPLLADGFSVITFDAPSHGDSDPGREGPHSGTMPELADAFQAVVAAHGPAYGVVAHSLGTAAFSQALKNGFAARRVVFLAAATDFRHTLDLYQGFLGFGPRTREQFLRRFTRKFGPMENFEVVSVIDQLVEERELPALLAIHDRSDRETAADGSVRIAQVWPGAELELTDGLGHHRVLWDKAVVESARAFLSGERAPADGAREVQGTMRG
ncbi:alpha/beta fold hydrolase [Kribbella sancticallisti]|uniref:Alpha/beta fold hydrolase n=1 Tax=Kribbella sancticallisti TaxID=460087 RepID=A0ABN2EPQ7_9ACTN